LPSNLRRDHPRGVDCGALWVSTDENNCRRKLINALTDIRDLVCSCHLDLDPMTFIYELDLHSLEIHGMYRESNPT